MNGGGRQPYDIVGVGFGPSNLALAVAAQELDPGRRCLFFERSPELRWHPGMLIEGARMQISFLKDLVTLRNPASPYTFLRYAQAQGRLEMFVNLNEFRLTRLEYQGYLRWVADAFADRARYGTAVTRVAPVRSATGRTLFAVDVRDVRTGRTKTHLAHNVVHAGGGRPRVPAGDVGTGTAVIHSSDFLPGFPERFDDPAQAYEFAVVGDGQSAGEVAAYLLSHYPRSRVHMFFSGQALRATDNNPFANEAYYGRNTEQFRGAEKGQRAALLAELGTTNYGVIEAGFLEDLYRLTYADAVKGERRLVMHPCTRVTDVRDTAERGVHAAAEHRFTGVSTVLACDGIVLATGYDRVLDPEIYGEVLPLLQCDETGDPMLSPDYRASTTTPLDCGLYLQGYSENSFGIGDTLLSSLPFRSRQIVSDIGHRTPAPAVRPAGFDVSRRSAYPPEHYLEYDVEQLHALMQRFNFATVISAGGQDGPVVTHVPLTLDRARGRWGVLFGHMDRSNPHAELIDGLRLTVLFHGPNSYISPRVFRGSPLPTWNSMTVHARGRGRLVPGRAELVRGLCGIAEHCDPGPDVHRLHPDDPRIDTLIDHIVGFEIEIEQLVGRFKLSQELVDDERQRAARELARTAARGEDELIEAVVGLPVSSPPGRNGFHQKDLEPSISRSGS